MYPGCFTFLLRTLLRTFDTFITVGYCVIKLCALGYDIVPTDIQVMDRVLEHSGYQEMVIGCIVEACQI